MNPQEEVNAPAPQPAVPPQPPQAPRRRRRWMGSVLALLLVVLVGGAAWYLVQRANGDSAAAPGAGPGRGAPGGGRPMVTVGDAVARRAELPVVIDALGTVIPATTVTLKPQVSGTLTEVLFTEGQMVKKGQLLAQIDPRPYEQALMQAQGTRQRDEAQLENARLTLARYQTLLSQDSIARQDVDTQAALVKQLEGTVMTDKAQEGTARLNLSYTRITSPATGRIGLRTVDAGNLVSSGDATGIATITQVAPIDVQFAVPQDRVADVLAAQRDADALAVTALDRTRKSELDKGRFSTLDNQIDTTTGTVKAKARFANAAGTLFPNQFVNVQLLLRNVPAIVVPVTAVRTGANGDYVYVINEDRTVTLRKVKRGQATVGLMAIAEGLKEGERVVTEGGDRLQDGMAVQTADGQGARGPRSGASGPRSGASGPRGERGERRQRPPQNP
ncbi:secretion protein HlyD [Acidovorax sp. Leaf76]|uniref:efflux RND transporter periplasmic adaptor subunit n=1 Tax=unclassified Acidovorax TaxID=2684926 RepID=UPI0006F7A41C|nr:MULTISPECIES: efflux RND transporter periplasmic adaptor subunit [unclassified Acidovorax]KQO24728.1 secretion protein HlyD [Acidovorax sp. Leaf76]KQO39733.1 secretion protein HlyD [Acidovorax sp. Leaf84]KQS25022.1 secretion protein HlyD [Acidovorax sp. Leaf191]